jgi:putative transcriptional regulator
MPIQVTLDAVLQARGMTAKALAERIDMSETQLSLFRSGKVRGLRFSSLSKICLVLNCQPSDLLQYVPDEVDLLDGVDGPDVAVTGVTKRDE